MRLIKAPFVSHVSLRNQQSARFIARQPRVSLVPRARARAGLPKRVYTRDLMARDPFNARGSADRYEIAENESGESRGKNSSRAREDAREVEILISRILIPPINTLHAKESENGRISAIVANRSPSRRDNTNVESCIRAICNNGAHARSRPPGRTQVRSRRVVKKRLIVARDPPRSAEDTPEVFPSVAVPPRAHLSDVTRTVCLSITQTVCLPRALRNGRRTDGRTCSST